MHVQSDKEDIESCDTKQLKQAKDGGANVGKEKLKTRNQIRGHENEEDYSMYNKPEVILDSDDSNKEMEKDDDNEDAHEKPDKKSILKSKTIANTVSSEDNAHDKISSEDEEEDDDDDINSISDTVKSWKGICNDEIGKPRREPFQKRVDIPGKHRKVKKQHSLANKDNNYAGGSALPEDLSEMPDKDSRKSRQMNKKRKLKNKGNDGDKTFHDPFVDTERRNGFVNTANDLEELDFQSDNNSNEQSKSYHKEDRKGRKINSEVFGDFDPLLDNGGNRSNKPLNQSSYSNKKKRGYIKTKTEDGVTIEALPADNSDNSKSVVQQSTDNGESVLQQNLKPNKKRKGKQRDAPRDTEEVLYDNDDNQSSENLRHTKQRKKNIIETDSESNELLNEYTRNTTQALVGENQMRGKDISTNNSQYDEISVELSKQVPRHTNKPKKKNRKRNLQESNNMDRSVSQSERRLSFKDGNQHSRRRSSKSRYMRSVDTRSLVSDDSLSDDLSYYSTSVSLDSFHDTATEYYKDFDVEAFQRKQSLRDQLKKRSDKLPPLTNKTEGFLLLNDILG